MANVAYHDYDVAVGAEEECQRIGGDLADRHLMIMHNHGLLSCGRDPAEAFYLLYTLENACKVQVDSLTSNTELVYTKEDAAKKLSAYGKVKPDSPSRSSRLAWTALIRQLDATDTSYKD